MLLKTHNYFYGRTIFYDICDKLYFMTNILVTLFKMKIELLLVWTCWTVSRCQGSLLGQQAKLSTREGARDQYKGRERRAKNERLGAWLQLLPEPAACSVLCGKSSFSPGSVPGRFCNCWCLGLTIIERIWTWTWTSDM